MPDCARFCAFAYSIPSTFGCGAFVAQPARKRHSAASSLWDTCRQRSPKRRHLPLCSNTPHLIHYLAPNSTPRLLFCPDTQIPEYPDTLNLKMYAHIQEIGLRPHFRLEQTGSHETN